MINRNDLNRFKLANPDFRTTVSPETAARASRFNGKIHWVQIDLGTDAAKADPYISKEERRRGAMWRLRRVWLP